MRPSNDWSSSGCSVLNHRLYFAQFWSKSNKSGLLIIQDFYVKLEDNHKKAKFVLTWATKAAVIH